MDTASQESSAHQEQAVGASRPSPYYAPKGQHPGSITHNLRSHNQPEHPAESQPTTNGEEGCLATDQGAAPLRNPALGFRPIVAEAAGARASEAPSGGSRGGCVFPRLYSCVVLM
jgi:hypothetical protein